MKKILITMWAITGILFATSCGNDEGGTTITLSEKVFEFTTDGGEQSLTVTADDEWFAVGTNWIHTKKEGNKLTVIVDANKTIREREGAVTVKAGNAVAIVKVVQKATVASVVATPGFVVVSDTEGQVVIEVKATDKYWTATEDVDWLKITPKQHKSEIIVDYTKNEVEEDRVATLTITVGEVEKLVEIKQLGKMFFVLPYTKMATATIEDVKAFEAARFSSINKDETRPGVLGFDTRSTDMFPMILYEVDEEKGTVKRSQTAAITAEKMDEQLPAFKEWLKVLGFVQESEFIFVNKELRLTATIEFTDEWGMRYASVYYNPILEQDRDYPTFKELPKLFVEWGAKKDKIDAYEAEHGGTYDKDKSRVGGTNENGEPYKDDFFHYNISEDNQGEEQTFIRGYWVYTDEQPEPGLIQTAQIMYNTELVFFMIDDEYFLTREFKELCKKEGFEYIGKPGMGFYGFKNPEKGLMLMVRLVKLQGSKKLSIDYRLSKLTEQTSVKEVGSSYLDIKSLYELVK